MQSNFGFGLIGGLFSTFSLCSLGLIGRVLSVCSIRLAGDVSSICSLCGLGLAVGALSVRILGLLSACNLFIRGLTGICDFEVASSMLPIFCPESSSPICRLCGLGLAVGALSVRILGLLSACNLLSLGLTGGVLVI